LSYSVEAEVLPQGAGMIQIGFDYTTATDGGTHNEAVNSHWICSKPNSKWVTVRIGGFS